MYLPLSIYGSARSRKTMYPISLNIVTSKHTFRITKSLHTQYSWFSNHTKPLSVFDRNACACKQYFFYLQYNKSKYTCLLINYLSPATFAPQEQSISNNNYQLKTVSVSWINELKNNNISMKRLNDQKTCKLNLLFHIITIPYSYPTLVKNKINSHRPCRLTYWKLWATDKTKFIFFNWYWNAGRVRMPSSLRVQSIMS